MNESTSSFETLVADLHGPDWEKRCDAARLLGLSRDMRAVDTLLPDLQDRDWRVRRNAVQALGALKTPRAVEPLLQALNDRTQTVRQRAAVALGRIKDPAAIPALVQVLLESEYSAAGEAAFQALKKFGRLAGPHVLEALRRDANLYLIDLLPGTRVPGQAGVLIELAGHKNVHVRRKAIEALGKIQEPEALAFLTRALDSDDPTTKVLAIQSLSKLGAMQALPKILDLLRPGGLYGPSSGVHHAVAEAFQQMSGVKAELEQVFPGRYPDVFSITHSPASLPEVVGSLGEEHFEKLNQMLASMEKRMQETASLLNLPPELVNSFSERTWSFGALFADARDARAERVKLLIGLLASDSALKRAAAALTLAWYVDASAVGPLEEAAHDADPMVRKSAEWALGTLLEALRGKGDAETPGG
jgi:HEAT repeat protein